MKIISLAKSGALLLPLIAAEGAKLNAEPPPEKDKIVLTKDFIETDSVSNTRANNNKALIALKDNLPATLLTSTIETLSNYKTNPNIINCSKRNLTKEELQKEIKDTFFGYRWYRNGRFHLSNADQIKYAHNRCNMPRENYRELFVRYEHDKNETYLGKLCRAYIPPDPKGKPMYVLTLGHTQKLTESSKDSGIVAIYERLVREEKGIVLMFITGSVLDEVDNALAFQSRFTEHEVLFAHMERNIKDFIDQYNPKELRLAGFSWGGGAIAKLSKNEWWRSNVPVKSTVFIDAINMGGRNLATACRTRPNFGDSPKHHHYHIYQRKDGIHPLRVQGNYPTITKYSRKVPISTERDLPQGDVHWRVPDTEHNSLDDLPDVREWAYVYLLRD